MLAGLGLFFERVKVLKRVFCLLMCLALALTLGGCKDEEVSTGATHLSFSSAVDFKQISKLDGQIVTITGYMATLSPLNGKYMYLMNLPYQSCPFCLPNTNQLSNTMAVYAQPDKAFAFTDQPIRVTGKIDVGNFKDDFGYTYNYRIVDATYEAVDLSSVSSDFALWQSIASDGIVADVYAMFDYLYFLCNWTEYTGYSVMEDGTRVDWYMYPGDVHNYLADTGAYGYATQASEGYFPGLIARVNAISADKLGDFVSVIEKARETEIYARAELAAENYVYDQQADKYTLNNHSVLLEKYRQAYLAFDEWLTRWEL